MDGAMQTARDKTLGTAERSNYSILRSTLAEYERNLLPQDETLLSVLEDIRKAYPERSPLRVLDFGCGDATAIRDFSQTAKSEGMNIDLTGISVGDIRTREQKEYDREHGINFIDQEKSILALPANHFDVVLSRWTFLHLANPLQTLKKIVRSLKPGGRAYIHWPNGFLEYKCASREASERIMEILKASSSDMTFGWDDFGVMLSVEKHTEDARLRFPEIYLKQGTPRDFLGNETQDLLYTLREKKS